MKPEALRTPVVVLACGCLIMCVSFATAAAFSAYLRPGMLIEFANLVLCG